LKGLARLNEASAAGAGRKVMKLDMGLRRQVRFMSRAVKRAMRLRGEEGGALLEFAITLPLLMTVLTGAASFSLAFYSLQQLGNAVSSASQLVAAEQGLITDPCAQAVTSVTGSLPGWTASKLTYTMVITDSSGSAHTYGPTAGSSFSCTAGAALEAPNEPVTLTVSYAYTWMPILAFSPSSPLTSTEAALAD
jgi:Flp pilus assembly protein TadG